MSQHDYNVANQTGALVRADFNNALLAIVSNNSGTSAPGSPQAYEWWLDTTNNLLKVRNAANSAWITVGTPSVSNLGFLTLAGGTMTGALLAAVGSVGAPGVAFSGDLDSGFYWVSSNTWGLVSNGVEYLRISPAGITFLGTGAPILPSGTTAQRPGSPVNGMMRYNTDLTIIEVYVNGAWKVLASSASYPFTIADFNDKDYLGGNDSQRMDFSGNGNGLRNFANFDYGSATALSSTTVDNASHRGSISPCGEYIAMGNSGNNPAVLIYQRVDSRITKLADPATLPPGPQFRGNCARFSPCGTYCKYQ